MVCCPYLKGYHYLNYITELRLLNNVIASVFFQADMKLTV